MGKKCVNWKRWTHGIKHRPLAYQGETRNSNAETDSNLRTNVPIVEGPTVITSRHGSVGLYYKNVSILLKSIR